MWRNFSTYFLSVKSRLTLLFEIYNLKASTARIVLRGHLSWLGKNITRHYLSKEFTMLFLLTVIAILVNELPRKIIRYQVIIFTQGIKQVKASFLRRSACCCRAAETFPCGFDLHDKYLDSGHTRPPVLKKGLGLFPFFRLKLRILQKLFKIFRNPSTCVSMQATTAL